MAFHDLTTILKPPKNLRSLLGLSLKFIPNPRHNVPWADYKYKTLQRFERDLKVKTFMIDKILADEAAAADDPDADPDDDYNPRMYARSDWVPPEKAFPFPRELPRRIAKFTAHLKSLVKKTKCRSNLLSHQRKALSYLRTQTDLLIVQCDKNLGPAVIERDEYIKLAFKDHLNDNRTYERLTPTRARSYHQRIKRLLKQWMKKHKKVISRNEKRFLLTNIEANVDPFATFYMTMKVHKTPLKTRPIVSCSGTLLESLGVWVDSKLQIAAKKQPSYFKSSFDLKKELVELEIPENALLFTADAESMYTNIPTDRALNFIGKYLKENEFPDIPVEALMTALRLVMKHNIFTFGDTTWLQTTGTAMGTPPAPPWATLYYALLELEFLAKFAEFLFLYKRFIDDVIAMWLFQRTAENAAKWTEFQAAMNDERFGLRWIVSPLSKKVDFMDMTISINKNKIETTLYEKPSNHHLFIPPHSCHPPGLLPGIVHGMIFRIHTLCTAKDDITERIREFLHQLQRRGYQARTLRPLFNSAIVRAKNYTGTDDNEETLNRNKLTRSLLFHLQYHPNNPPSRDIQNSWTNYLSEPPHSKPLAEIRNYRGTPIGINRMIIAYNRPPNLGNLLSYRKLKPTNGPPVSSFQD